VLNRSVATKFRTTDSWAISFAWELFEVIPDILVSQTF